MLALCIVLVGIGLVAYTALVIEVYNWLKFKKKELKIEAYENYERRTGLFNHLMSVGKLAE